MKNLGLFLGLIILIVGGFVFWSGTPSRYITEGSTDLSSGKVAKAIETLNEGLNRYPDDEQIIFLLAKAYLLTGEVEDVNKVITEKKLYNILSGKEDFQDFLVDLAEANHRSGNVKSAIFFANKYISLQPKDEASKRVVKNLIRVGQILPEESVKIWENAFNIASALHDSESKESLKALLLPKYLQIAKDFHLEGKYDEAIDILDRAKVVGKSAEVCFQEALVYKDLKKFELSAKKFEEAISLQEDNEDYKIAYAEAIEEALKNTDDKEKKQEYSERIKLLIGSDSTNPKGLTLLNKIINLNAKFKLGDSKIVVSMVGEFYYPTVSFKINQVSDIPLRNYRIIFFEGNGQNDIYETAASGDELNQPIEVTSKNPVTKDSDVSARIFLNKEYLTEIKTPQKFTPKKPPLEKEKKEE